jgi:hypothetical protein
MHADQRRRDEPISLRTTRLTTSRDHRQNPNPVILSKVPEDNPFAQYWALKTLRRQLHEEPEALDSDTLESLEGLNKIFGPGTDRAYELRQLLAEARRH